MKPQIWPVIHVKNLQHTLEDVQTVKDAGCDGVFLISMEGRDQELAQIACEVRLQFPKFKVGVNFLSLDAYEAFMEARKMRLDATWADRPGVDSEGVDLGAKAISGILQATPGHLFFASVAFKYQPHEQNPLVAASLAHYLGMIPTTSGASTGKPPSAWKLKHMASLGAPLAVASGISSENVLELGKYVTHILIASSINTNDRLDKAKLCEFMAVVNTHLW